MLLRTIVFLSCACMALSCAKTPETPQGAIKINSKWIKASEIEEVAAMLRQQMLQMAPQEGLMGGVSDDIRKKTAKQLIAQELVLQEAERRKLVCSDSLIDSLVGIYKTRFGGDSMFTSLLVRNGQTIEVFRSQLREGFLLDSIMKILLGTIDTVSEAECKKFYTDNPDKFKDIGKIRARHILLSFGKDTSAAALGKLRTKAEMILGEARNGKDFAKLAKRYSNDPNSKNGGDIGWFKRGDLMPELENPLFAQKVGGITEIIVSKMGYHILQKSDQADSAAIPYDNISWKIRKNIEMAKEQDRMEQVVDSMIAKANIVYADTTYKP
jgi:peptidyl-prolyl cis-trans isomerase C